MENGWQIRMKAVFIVEFTQQRWESERLWGMRYVGWLKIRQGRETGNNNGGVTDDEMRQVCQNWALNRPSAGALCRPGQGRLVLMLVRVGKERAPTFARQHIESGEIKLIIVLGLVLLTIFR